MEEFSKGHGIDIPTLFKVLQNTLMIEFEKNNSFQYRFRRVNEVASSFKNTSTELLILFANWNSDVIRLMDPEIVKANFLDIPIK
jgi:hypothetical protein